MAPGSDGSLSRKGRDPMTLLPLFPSRTSGLAGPPAPSDSCRFCGFEARAFMQQAQHGAEIVAACLLCALCQGLDRPRIADEVVPIWLPEMTQRALVAVVRRLHLVCHAHGQAPTMLGIPPPGSPVLSQAWGLHMALVRRVSLAKARLGTTDVAELAEALDEAARAGADVHSLLGALRLLPLGRFFDGRGVDVYPNVLAAYVASTKGMAA